jgi:hypothetical protein
MTDRDAARSSPAPWSLDPFGLWRAWARALEVHAPLSGAVNQAIETSLARSLGQLGLINITTARAGDPDLERRIVEQVASYGRQLGWLLEAVDALVRGHRGEPPQPGDEQALEQARRLRGEVDELKQRAAAERLDDLVGQIHLLRREPEANADALAALRRALDGA